MAIEVDCRSPYPKINPHTCFFVGSMRKVRLMLAQYEAYLVPIDTTITPSFRLLSSLMTETLRSNLQQYRAA